MEYKQNSEDMGKYVSHVDECIKDKFFLLQSYSYVQQFLQVFPEEVSTLIK